MKEEHILISVDGPECNVLKLKPPMIFTKENVNEVLSTLDRVLKEWREINDDLVSSELGLKIIDTRSKEPRARKQIHEEQIKSI